MGKTVKMKISLIFIVLHFTSTFSFPQFGGIFGEGGGFTCLGGKKCYYGRRRKRSSVEISEKLNTMETIPEPNNMEISLEADTVEISQEPVNVGISPELDTKEITVKPDSVKTSEYPYLVPFTFPSSDERSINLFPFGLSFPWFSFSSSIQQNPGEKISAESDQETQTRTPGEESTAHGSVSEYSVPAWFQSPTNVSLHKFLFPFGSSFPFGGR